MNFKTASKEDPAKNAGSLKIQPRTVTVEGAAKKPRVFDNEELLKMAPFNGDNFIPLTLAVI